MEHYTVIKKKTIGLYLLTQKNISDTLSEKSKWPDEWMCSSFQKSVNIIYIYIAYCHGAFFVFQEQIRKLPSGERIPKSQGFISLVLRINQSFSLSLSFSCFSLLPSLPLSHPSTLERRERRDAIKEQKFDCTKKQLKKLLC